MVKTECVAASVNTGSRTTADEVSVIASTLALEVILGFFAAATSLCLYDGEQRQDRCRSDVPIMSDRKPWQLRDSCTLLYQRPGWSCDDCSERTEDDTISGMENRADPQYFT